MITDEDCANAVKKLEAQEIKAALRQRQIEDAKPLELTQDEEDVNDFIEKVRSYGEDGIIEFNLQKLLKLGSQRRYERCRRNALSFCRGSITLDRKARKFLNHKPTVEPQTKLEKIKN